ncbi:MAG: hypothetical protein A2X86_10665 [Bdellovibrionales bacterium GWA2_49_15]|nr:MAG: hypothetical protein A2X86_10665 [Bdellovibrionales bacterium GWA2_49_15]HAZ11437.1 hypothetical protein [Bdellovibrionales bacterium]
MGEPVKKVDPAAPLNGAAKDSKIGLEKTMLLNLQKLKEANTGEMKAEDLEYPDVPAKSSSSESSKDSEKDIFDDDLLAEEKETVSDGTSTEVTGPALLDDVSDGLPDIDALALDDDIDISDVTNSIQASKDEDPLASGFELDDDSLSHGSASAHASSEDEGEEDDQGHEVGEITTKRDLVRLKRKLALEEKKKQREKTLIQQEEERKRREEYEKQNNIFSIAELKRKADEEKSKTNVGSYDEMFGSSDMTTVATVPKSALVGKPTLTVPKPKAAPAPEQQATSTANSGTSHGTSQGTANFGNHAGPSGGALQGGIPMIPYTLGPPRKWYEALGISIGTIFAEILKVATPALIVGYFLLQQQDTHNSQKAINHIMSGNQFEMELGLSLLKKHFTSENNSQYYSLVKMKVEKDIDEVWKVEEIQESKRADKLKEFVNYTFVDGALNLPQLVQEKMELHKKKVMELYTRFYDTEMKDVESKVYTDHLRQANIFLTTGECVKSYDKYGQVQGIMADSYAALYGKVLAFNCAIMKDPQKAFAHFSEQMAKVEMAQTKKRIAEINKLMAEENRKSVFDQKTRSPASSSGSKKSYR